MPSTAPANARARARAELIEEIKTVGRRHLAEQGSAALSLRAVARELGMVSSAVYRYFPSRDQLLTALIIDAYDAVGAAAEGAALESRRARIVSRWVAVAEAIRAWTLANPHEYALIYGSPVPGYAAPADTIDPAARVPLALVGLVADALKNDEIAMAVGRHPIPRSVRADLSLVRTGTNAEIPDEVLARVFQAWSQLIGTLTLEMFGHLHNVIHDYDAYFRYQMRRAAESIAAVE